MCPFPFRGEWPAGIIIDLWHLWSQKTGIAIDFRKGTWDESLAMVRDGTADAHAGLFYKPDRDRYLDYAAPLRETDTHFFHRSDLPRITELAELLPYRIGVLSGDAVEGFIQEKLPRAEVVGFPDYGALITALKAGRLHVFAADTPTGLHHLKKNGLLTGFTYPAANPLYRSEWFAAAGEGNRAMVDRINRGMARITEAEKRDIGRQWGLGGKVSKSDELIIAIDRAYAPLSALNALGDPSGLLVELWKRWSQRTGRKVRFQAFGWPETLEKLRSGEVDIHAGLAITGQRAEWIGFSQPLYETHARYYFRGGEPVTIDAAGLRDKRVGVLRNSVQEAHFHQNHPTVTRIGFPTLERMLKALLDRRIDLFLGEEQAVDVLLDRMGLHGNIDRAPAAIFNSTLHAGVRKDRQPLLQEVVAGLQSLSSQELNRLESRWIADPKKRYFPNQRVELSPAEQTWMGRHRVWRVANELDWPPFDFVENGKPVGFSIDFIKMAAQNVGAELHFINGHSWEELLALFKKGQLDILPAVYRTEERDAFIAFTAGYADNPSVLILHANDEKTTELNHLAGRPVAVVAGYATAQVMKTRHPDIRQMPVKDVAEGLKAVSMGGADAFVGSLGVIAHVMEKNFIPNIRIAGDARLKTRDESRLRMGVAKDRILLRNILEKGLDAITADEIKRIRQRWMPFVGNRLAEKDKVKLTGAERRWLAEHPRLRLGVDPAWPPFEFIDDDGVYSGIGSGYAEIIARRLDIDMEPVPDLTWSQVIDRAKAGEIDVLPTVMRTPEREKYLTFTKPYISFPVVIATRRSARFIDNLTDLNEQRVGVVKDYVTEQLLRRHHPELQLFPYPTLAKGLAALNAGRLDAFVDNLGAISFEMGRAALEEIKIAAPTRFNFELAMAVRKDWPELTAILDKALDSLDNQERGTIKNTWMAMEVTFGTDIETILQWAVPVLLVIVLILILIMYWNHRLGREIADRRRAQTALARERELLVTVLGSIHQGLVAYDRDLRLIICNRRFKEIRDVPEELTRPGTPFADWIRYDVERGEFGPGDPEEQFKTIVERGKLSGTHQFERVRVDGTVIQVEGGALPGGGFVSTFTDITQRRRHEAQIKKLSSAVEQSPVSVFITDTDGIIEYSNSQFTRVTGYEAGEARGKKAEMLRSDKNDAGPHRDMWLKLGNGQPWSGVLLNRRKNGESYWESCSISPIKDDTGRITHHVSVGEDVTEQTRLQKERDDAMRLVAGSIQYASRIQRSILPPEAELMAAFADCFILWEPRDVVGGDMYWHRPWGGGSLVLLGDCTGHGVPGAFMTLISNGALSEAYLETPPGDPAILLQRMHQLIQTALGQDRKGLGSADDGIEIGACYLDDHQGTLTFAGARFDLFILQDGAVEIIKGTKAGLGYRGTPQDIRFRNHRLDTAGRAFYMTSDGLTDQIGGPLKRGFGKRRFKSLLATIANRPMAEQKEIIHQALIDHQGDQKRRDDVSVIGFRSHGSMTGTADRKRVDMDPALLVDFKPIDDDHRRLFGLVDRLNDAIVQGREKKNIIAILDELIDYTAWHFRHEDRLMRTHGFPGQAEHQKAHDALVEQVLAIQKNVKENDADVSTDLLLFLLEWLNVHIHDADKKLADFLNQALNGTAGADDLGKPVPAG